MLAHVSRLRIHIVFICVVSIVGCWSPKLQLTAFTVNIDWVPSPEYYGFFYAQGRGFYEEAGLSVTIVNGTGAPAVAKQLSAGAAYAGTTTSDNLLREMSAGSAFGAAIPLLKFNPCVLVVRPGPALDSFEKVVGKRIGTNKEASVYSQFLKLLADRQISPSALTEIPIGYGGADVFKLGDVDGFLAYTTNVVVDLEAATPRVAFNELHFGASGLESFGTVLIFNYNARDKPAALGREHFDAFARATLRGYAEGASDVPGAIQALRAAAPTLDPNKLRLAIDKIVRLNSSTNYDLARLDRWVPEVRAEALAQMHHLLREGLSQQR